MLIPFAQSAQCSLDRFEHMYLSKQASKRLYNIYVLAHPIHSGAGRTIFALDGRRLKLPVRENTSGHNIHGSFWQNENMFVF